ncbi:alpha/beta hydrolase [Amycolatopsis pithecellobii]|uniref:Alpha/beta hydrolase n=1 Tax=Amycolatopsis pithecellobii TaxID=664692 RepID=A0A6N7Z338_9PSEU|nr:alpha/beta hydrolase [Amycolatopsis pithecellobii]MTD54374.1 alpha/beta hydrolase [Amycolatopsis pithecellobii]
MSDYTEFEAPQGLHTRGTVVVVPGRGETHGTYSRLGRRLAADAYQVRVIDPPAVEETDIAGSLSRLAGKLAAAVADAELPRPLVLAGADSGAAAIAALLAGRERSAPWWPDGVVLAGLPGYGGGETKNWEEELEVRTSCVVHRGVLSGDPSVQRGSLAVAVPDELLDTVYAGGVDVPQLILAGDADPLADRDALARAVKTAPTARFSVVHGAHHDVLNDRQHRSVAAEIVTFLETLGNNLVPVLTVESSTW